MQYGTEYVRQYDQHYKQHGGEVALHIHNFSQDFLTPHQSIHAVTGMNLTARRGKITALVAEKAAAGSPQQH